ncbi:hypothetical protein DFH09DRAFT_1098510 [Mycena vulgaris]|nr:hypothetical protein DFH09DRAFT_1098510 [Mycena vulgaris]
MGAIGHVGVRGRRDGGGILRAAVMMYVLRVSQRRRRQAMGGNGVNYGGAYTVPSIVLDLEERYLRTVKRVSDFSGTWVRAKSTQSLSMARRGALGVQKTAMQLPEDANDEIREDSTWSWWPAAARR